MVLIEQCILASNKFAMKKFLVLLFIGLLALPAMGQSRFEDEKEEKDNTPPREQTDTARNKPNSSPRRNNNILDRIRFGGNLGLQFGNPTFINISPRIYYLATDKIWLGIGGTYMYTRYKAPFVPFETSTYGGNLSVTYQIFQPIFLQAEYEPLNFDSYNPIAGEYERIWVQGVLLGGGISQQIGRGAVFLSALYNVTWLDANRSFYGSPWVIRIGFGI
jgi:hypothetical protein